MKLCLKLVLILFLIDSIVQSAVNVASNKDVVCYPMTIPCVPFTPCISATSYLVDGNILTLTTTMPGNNAWVAVDLVKAYQVVHVVISGQVGAPTIVNNLGITNTDPSSVPPDPSNYNLCEQYALPVIPVITRTALCPLNLYPRRWVVYQQMVPILPMSLAEMEVYVAQKRATRYDRSEGQRVVKDSALIGSPFSVLRRVDCMIPCLKSEDCDSFNFRSSDRTCELHDWVKGVTPSTDIIADPDWDLWQPSYAVADL